MKTACLTVFVSIASYVCLSFCYPLKPLNERSTELSWEAWLLVDQSNKQSDLGVLRRKITPKSVFIAPTFSPESLPACAEGYKSDSMGRCVKIIKINESVHFDFLLQKLNEQFPDYEEENEDGAAQGSAAGPLQLNIPLVGDGDVDRVDEKKHVVENESDADVAIVVTPATASGNKRDKTTSLKVDVRRKGNDKFDVESVAAILGVKPEDVEMTTMAELTTSGALTTTVAVTEEVTVESTTQVAATTTTGEATTTEGDAIFFRWKI